MSFSRGIWFALLTSALLAACSSDSSGDPAADTFDSDAASDATSGDATDGDAADSSPDAASDADPADTSGDVPVQPDAVDDTSNDAIDGDTDTGDGGSDAAGDTDLDVSDTGDTAEPTDCEALACETLNRLCVEPIEPGDTARCGECSIPFIEADGICIPPPCFTDRDCPARDSSEWSVCERTSSACTTAGEERRTVYSPVCGTDGECGWDESTETNACVVDPVGLRCETSLGRVGECNPANECVVPADAPLVDALPPEADVVRLRIVAPAGASSLRIYRDGVPVGTPPVPGSGELIWTDTSPELSSATPGPVHSFVQEADPRGTRVSWTMPPLPTGVVHSYEVSAVVSGSEGRRSTPDDAYALGPAPDGMLVQIGSARPLSVPVGDSYVFGSRDLPQGSYGSIVTSVGEPPSEAWVALRVVSYEAIPGDPVEVSFTLQNRNGDGERAAVDVRSLPGEPFFLWERAPTAGGPFTELVDVLGADVVDPTADPDGEEAWYRPLLRNRASVEAYGPAARGAVIVPNYGMPCTTGVDCPVPGAPAWCPTNTTERVCTPRPLLPGGIELPFVTIPAGTYTMGSPTNEVGRVNNEDAHTVQIPRRFAITRTELTRQQWSALTGGSVVSDVCDADDCPLRYVTIYSAMMWANALSRHMQLPECYNMPTRCDLIWQLGSYDCTGDVINLTTARPHQCEGYRLCNEAEWEYAARAGVSTATPGGNFATANNTCYSDSLLNPWAYYCIGGAEPSRVAQLQPNAWGLYDMLGNVLEYVWDQYTARLGTAGIVDPWTARFETGASATLRGGRVGLLTQKVRYAAREFQAPNNPSADSGIRLCRSLD